MENPINNPDNVKYPDMMHDRVLFHTKRLGVTAKEYLDYAISGILTKNGTVVHTGSIDDDLAKLIRKL